MFCPKCARPTADEVQFCQQCGQQLGEVRKALEPGGAADTAAKPSRRKGLRQGFKLTLVSLVLLLLYPAVEALLGELIPSEENTRLDELPLELFGTLVLILFAAGLMRMLYAYFFEGRAGEAATTAESAKELSGAQGRQALPPSQSIPAADFASPRISTADLAAPRGSVTEHTTRGLRRE